MPVKQRQTETQRDKVRHVKKSLEKKVPVEVLVNNLLVRMMFFSSELAQNIRVDQVVTVKVLVKSVAVITEKFPRRSW